MQSSIYCTVLSKILCHPFLFFYRHKVPMFILFGRFYSPCMAARRLPMFTCTVQVLYQSNNCCCCSVNGTRRQNSHTQLAPQQPWSFICTRYLIMGLIIQYSTDSHFDALRTSCALCAQIHLQIDWVPDDRTMGLAVTDYAPSSLHQSLQPTAPTSIGPP